MGLDKEMNRNFLLLLAGQMVSQIGDKFHMIAVSFWVLKTTGSSAQMGAVLAASLVPSVVVSLFSGAVIDRYDRKWIIVGTDLIRGIIIAGFALLFYLGRINLPVVLIMQALLSVNAAFFDPAVPALIPTIVSRDELAAANSRHQLVNGISIIAGAFMGGILVSITGYLAVFILNALSFIVSAGFEWRIDIPHTRGTGDIQGVSGRRVIRDMADGYAYLLSKSGYMILLFMVMVIHFFVGSIEVMMPVIADSLPSGGARNLGFFQAAFGAGTVGMAIVISSISGFGNEKKGLFGSVLLIGLLYLACAAFRPDSRGALAWYLFVLAALGGCIICAAISFRTLLQKRTDNSFAGRVFAVAGSLGNASIPVAMIIYGLLLELTGFRLLLAVSGACLVPLSILSFIFYKEKE